VLLEEELTSSGGHCHGYFQGFWLEFKKPESVLGMFCLGEYGRVKPCVPCVW
jgi:hypothetical protein